MYSGFSLPVMIAGGASFLTLFITDIILNLIQGFPAVGTYMLYLYPIYVIIGLLSKLVIKKADQYVRIPLMAVGSSCLFFVLSNFGVFLKDGIYSWARLSQTYVDAIPFFKTELLATAIFTALMFGYHNLFVRNETSATVTSQNEKILAQFENDNALEI